MAYIYYITFNIDHADFGALSIGQGLQRSLGYLRALLPNEPGYISSRAMYSISDAQKTHLIFESVWETWDDIQLHRSQSKLDEEHLLHEFKLKVKLLDLEASIYEEVA